MLNKILTKSLYIKSKQIDINYGQLIVLSVLTSLESDEVITSNIDCILNKTDKTTLKANILQMINDNINMDRLNFGIINSEFGGYGQYILEFDIWNNEPAVTYGFTKTIFEDAENCKVYINDIW